MWGSIMVLHFRFIIYPPHTWGQQTSAQPSVYNSKTEHNTTPWNLQPLHTWQQRNENNVLQFKIKRKKGTVEWFNQLVDNGAYALSNMKHGLFINIIIDQQEYAIFEDGEVSQWNVQDRMPMGTWVVNGTYTGYNGSNDLEPVQITNEDVIKEIMSLVKNKKKEG